MAAQALESALRPLPFPFEVIFSDNASSDSTPELQALFPGARYVRRIEPLSMATHWNTSVSEANGKYVKLLCDDDWLIPGALEREVHALEADDTLAACASARYEVCTRAEPLLKRWRAESETLRAPDLHWKMLIGENIIGPPSCVTFRKSYFQGFPAQFSYAADWAAWILLSDHGALRLLPEPGVNFRLHESNLTLRHVEDGTDFLEVQALRRECLNRLAGAQKLFGGICLCWIYCYRLARRVMRYILQKNPTGLITFLRKLPSYRQSPLKKLA